MYKYMKIPYKLPYEQYKTSNYISGKYTTFLHNYPYKLLYLLLHNLHLITDTIHKAPIYQHFISIIQYKLDKKNILW